MYVNYKKRKVIRKTTSSYPFPLRDNMVEQSGWLPREALAMDLFVGHIHAHHYARRDAPLQCHRPVKRRARYNANSASAFGRERPPMPQLPQLRALQQESQETPLIESPLPSSPRSGHRRARPYGPVEDAVEGFFCYTSAKGTMNQSLTQEWPELSATLG